VLFGLSFSHQRNAHLAHKRDSFYLRELPYRVFKLADSGNGQGVPRSAINCDEAAPIQIGRCARVVQTFVAKGIYNTNIRIRVKSLREIERPHGMQIGSNRVYRR
jgi:hypothetical protein